MPRSKKPSELVLGFIGNGEVEGDNVEALLADHIKGHGGDVRLIIPATKEHFSEGISAVLDYALEQEIPFEVITDGTLKGRKGRFIDDAAKEHKGSNVAVLLTNRLKKADTAQLIALCEEEGQEEDDTVDAIERAVDSDIEALDLTSGLQEIVFTDDLEPEEEPEGDDEPEEEAVEAFDPEEATFAELKAYAQEHGIDVPPRTKTAGYVRAIQAWQEAGGTPDPEEEPNEPETASEGAEEGAEPNLPEVRTTRESISLATSNGHGHIGVMLNFDIEVDASDAKAADNVTRIIKAARSL